ncbi:MAG: energy transducer TonB [Massilia sp.]
MFSVKKCSKPWLAAALCVLSLAAQGAEPTASLLPGCAMPDYPRASAIRNETGAVTISLLVGADGRPTGDAKIVRTSGYRDLDRAALIGISRCRFQPPVVDGAPVPGWAEVKYTWEINGPRAAQLKQEAAAASPSVDKAGGR